jgi:hypothetical protein
MELFNMYVDECNTLSKTISGLIETAEEPSQLKEINIKLDELEGNIKQMGIEAAGVRGTEKQICTDKVSRQRELLAGMKKDYSDKKFLIENKHLMGTKSGADRLRLKTINDKAADSNELLLNSIARIEEMNENSNVIIEELQHNSERIKGAQAKVCFSFLDSIFIFYFFPPLVLLTLD